MIREVHGLIVRKIDTGLKSGKVRIFVKDDDDGVVIGLSSPTYDACLSPDEARMFAQQVVEAADRIEGEWRDTIAELDGQEKCKVLVVSSETESLPTEPSE